ncbi:MAG: T9SS type A sorting domain-containing protein, partial [Flavobacterium sp.]
GTLICNNAAINLKNGTSLEGRALSTNGGILTDTVIANMPVGCENLGTEDVATRVAAKLYPNPFTDYITISVEANQGDSTLVIFNSLGQTVTTRKITEATTRIDTDFVSGIYFYKLTDARGNVQSGKLMAK